MKLRPTQARFISTFLLFTMLWQSFTPYIPLLPVYAPQSSAPRTEPSKPGALAVPSSEIEVSADTPVLSEAQGEENKTLSSPSVSRYPADLLEGEIGILSRHFDNPEDNLFRVYLDQPLSPNQKVYLSYDLYGISDKSGVSRSINDRLSRGGYVVSTHFGWTRQKELLDARWLLPGENRIQFGLPSGADFGYKIRNLQIEVEPDFLPSEWVWESVSYSRGDTYVRGFTRALSQGQLHINGHEVSVDDGEFEALLPGSLNQVALTAQGKTIYSIPAVAGETPDYHYPVEFTLTQARKTFQKTLSLNRLELLGATLEISGSRLLSDRDLSVQALRSRDLPALDMGLENVTAQAGGYRFLPHGEHFTEGAVLQLAYDRSQLPHGYTEQDIRTYYFDLNTKHWVALERDSIDTENQRIISRTTHFTDMINGVLQAPESPETHGFTPTMLSDLQAADPLSKVQLISPPTANTRGSASLSYSFEMPPGRNGMSPSLGIQYNSDGSSGWLGEGWDLNVPGITVDTRWGVPRYDPALETETYLMDGVQLVTSDAQGTPSLSHRGDKIPRESDRFFFPRKEGNFAKIQRKGSSPSQYTWEVTDRKGTQYTYGGNNGILQGSFTDREGNRREVISEWKLSRVEELHGDYIDYIYEPQSESVRGDLSSRALYLKEVRAGIRGESPHTVVKLIRGKSKHKQTHGARYGYLTSSHQLLTRAEIYFEGSKLREYEFEYKDGEFHTDLLDKIIHKDDTGQAFTHHRLDYYNDVEAAGGYFQATENWNTHDDGLSAGFVNPLSQVQQTGDFSDKSTALGGNISTSKGTNIYVGVGRNDGKMMFKTNTGGVSSSYSYSESKGISTLVDINGDGIADKVFVDFGSMYYRAGTSSGEFGAPIEIQGASQFSTSYTNSTSGGVKTYFTGTLGGDIQTTKSKSSRYFTDVNGDGLVDLIVGNRVYFNHIEKDSRGNLVPTFTLSSGDTPSPIRGGGRIDDSDTEVDPEEQAELVARHPLQDVVRLWVAPYDGALSLGGTVQLLPPDGDYDEEALARADGVRVAVQHNGTEQKSAVIAARDYSPKEMGIPALRVSAGDRLYFRVQSGTEETSNGDFDPVAWDPVITYIDLPATDDPNGHTRQYFAAAETLLSSDGVVMLPEVEEYTVKGSLVKPVTSDRITLTATLGDSQVVYERTFAAAETFNGDLEFSVTNSQQADRLQFSMHSPTHIAWETIHWAPRVVYTVSVDTGSGAPVDYEQTLSATAAVQTTYENMVNPGSSHSVAHAGAGKLRTSLTQKPGLSPEQIESITGNFELKLKDSSGVFYSGTLSLVGGSITEGSTREVPLPSGRVWVELYSSDADREGLRHLSSVQTILIDTLGVQTQAATAVYRNWELQGYGPLHRQWGHFSYNAMDGRARQPIRESLLVLPQSENDPNTDPVKMKFIPLHPDLQTRTYWEGNDPGVFIRGSRMSPSRLGLHDVILDNPLSGLGSTGNTSGSCLSGSGAVGIRQESKNVSQAVMGGIIGATVSTSTAEDTVLLSFADMNGDGYPDIISKGQIQLTNTRGGFDGDILKHNGYHTSRSSHTSLGKGGGAIHSSSLISKAANLQTAKANLENARAARSKAQSLGEYRLASEEVRLAEKAVSQAATALAIARVGSLIPSLEYNKGEDEAVYSYTDVNGDGLPDKILSDKRVRLNLGYSFTDPIDWNLDKIQKGKSESLSPGKNLLDIDKVASSWAGGIGMGSVKADTEFTLMDINGDGLADKVRFYEGTTYVSLNKGNSFDEEKAWNGIHRIHRSSSASESANAAFTSGFPIPFTTLKLVINPGVNTGKSMTRTLNDLKDVDGDGFLDAVSSDKERELQVGRSTIRRTNKLKTVHNPVGGSFTLDYSRSEASYDHPGGKWVVSSVEIDDGVRDDGAPTRVEYLYQEGKYDRHEREFLGFARVETRSIDTENGGALYRTTVEQYDQSDYYRSGNLLVSTLKDSSGNLYSETRNRYYAYEVQRRADGDYSLTTTELCADYQSAYTPLQYTQHRVYEGNPEGMIANESHYVYDLTDQYGELLRYRYSDRGSLGENGSGSYNYETHLSYTSNPSRYIYGLPVHVRVLGSNGELYREVQAAYDTRYANHLTQLRQKLSVQGDEALTDLMYDRYGNITRKTLPANHKGERMWYSYRYDRDYNMYLERIDDAYGYTSEWENYDYRYGLPLSTKDYNGYYQETALDNLGRIVSITGPNEMERGLPYTIKFEYSPVAVTDDQGEIQQPAYAVTRHYDPQHPGDDLETVSFVDGIGRALQVKKEGLLSRTDAGGSSPQDQEVWIVSGRNRFDPYGRVVASYYPVTEEKEHKLRFNRSFDAVSPTRIRYDVLDRTVETTLPDNSRSTASYTLNTPERSLVTTLTDAMGGRQATYTNGTGLTTRTEQLSGPSGVIRTRFTYDPVNQLLEVTDTEGQTTTSAYDLAGRRTRLTHPSAGTTLLTYDPLGNILTRQTANLSEKNLQIEYEYQYTRLTRIRYPENPQADVTYHYGGKNARENRIGRVVLMEDATGAQEFKYGTLGEVTEVRRTVIIPNQAIATYVTQTKYDSWNRIESIIYPDQEKVEYSYNTAGLLSRVRGSKAYSYNYVEKIGYDKFEQRNYLRYCNGAETSYSYDPEQRRLSDLQVWVQPRTESGGATGIRRQLMDNRYTYDAVSNVLGISNRAPLPPDGQEARGGQMTHAYTYDGLYRLTGATGTYSGADNKSAGYSLAMSYDNLHNITAKSQQVSQQNIMFGGGLNAGYDLVYTYDTSRKNQIRELEDTHYRGEESRAEEKREENKAYRYDANGNLVYINSSLTKKDTTLTDKTGERKLKWDEENRLQALDDNGYISHYRYDAGGERTIKSSGHSEQVYVNSLFAGGKTQTSEFTAYVSPYLVVSPNGKYTKHYYIGSQRVVSKLGDIASFGADPRRIAYAGDGLDGIEIDWKSKYRQSLQDIKDSYEYFEVPYNGKDNDDYVYGEGFCCTQEPASRTKDGGIGTGNVNYERMQYYYHPDHLGSSSYLTSLDGDVVQHVEYLPFGEVFVEERNNSWNSPYLFNAKELDEQTGLYYYGARYYNPRESVWLSVDPLAEMFPGWSPYNYTLQNPVKLIDPTGMGPEGTNDIIIRGKDKNEIRIKAEGKDKVVNVPINLGSSHTLDLGLGKLDPKRFVVGYTLGAEAAASLGGGYSLEGNISVAQFTDDVYSNYNYVYTGGEFGGSIGLQTNASVSGEASFFVGYNTSSQKIDPESFSGESYSADFSMDIKAVVGGGIFISGFSSTPDVKTPGWKGISIGGSVGVGVGFNSGAVGASQGYTYLLSDVKPTSQRSVADRATNFIAPISSAVATYGVDKLKKLF